MILGKRAGTLLKDALNQVAIFTLLCLAKLRVDAQSYRWYLVLHHAFKYFDQFGNLELFYLLGLFEISGPTL